MTFEAIFGFKNIIALSQWDLHRKLHCKSFHILNVYDL